MSLDSKDERSAADYSTKGMVADVTGILAGTLLLMAALSDILQGLSAKANDDLYVAGNDYLYKYDTTTWSWVHLAVGASAVAIAIAIIMGASWGQVAGLIIAVVIVVTNFAFLPYYPFWSITVIALSGLVMWALCTRLSRQTRR
jgi:hypothetical protein